MAGSRSGMGLWALLAVLLAGLPGLLACTPAAAPPVAGGTEAASAASAAASPAPPPERLRVSFAATAATYAPIWVAQDAGLLAAQGFDAELLPLPSRQASQALVAREVDVGVFSGRTVVELRSQGTDVVVVAAPVLRILQSIIVQPEVRAPADLRGKQVAVTQFGSSVDFAARYLLERWGLRPDGDVTLLQLQTLPNIMAALEGRAVDGGVLSPPITLQAQAMGYRELGNMLDAPFEYPSSVVVVRGDLAREQPDRVRRVVRAVVEAIARIHHDRATTEAILQRYTAVDDPATLRQTYDLHVGVFQRLPLLTEAAMQAVIDELAVETPRAAEIAPASTMDMRFVRDLEAGGLLRELYP